MTENTLGSTRLIDRWFPCAAVDHACTNSTGSGSNEKAVFPWFASRPIAQARAAVACALLGDSAAARETIERAIHGNRNAIEDLACLVRAEYPVGRPVVVDIFSGRGIIPLEAARLGAVAVGIDLSPVATLAGRLLADYPLRDWSAEPVSPWRVEGRDDTIGGGPLKPRLVTDIEAFLAEVGHRVQDAMAPFYPKNPDGSFPWGYVWAISIPCDGCNRRFPLIGNLVLRPPYKRTNDPGQSLRITIDGDCWRAEVIEGIPDQQPTYSSAELSKGKKRKGKSARCPFCRHIHSLETVKAKGENREYVDNLLLAADISSDGKKIFRILREDEIEAVRRVDLSKLEAFGELSAIPDERIPEGNVHTVMASGYGYRTFGEMMCARQSLQFVATVRAIRECAAELASAGASKDYCSAMSAFAAATLVRRLRRATRGCTVQSKGKPDGSVSNTVFISDLFLNESKLSFQFDWFETGVGEGPSTWFSLCKMGLGALAAHMAGVRGFPAKLRQANAMSLPYRDGSVDAVVTDPPYYDMIEYADASDLFYVWLKRILFDIEPELFSPSASSQAELQNKNDEIIVRRVHEPGRIRHDKDFYEASLSRAFAEARRVLRPDGHLVVVFGHSDPDAWKRLLGALLDAGFVVTSSWPSRTESANTGVASIKVTVTIGCRVAPASRPDSTASEVDRMVSEAVKERVKAWNKDGLALVDQMMAAYGPAMEVYGRFSNVLQPDGELASLDHYLTLARRAVREATALRLDEIPLETFDAFTRFAVFWMRLYGRTNVPKGEARFLAQADNLRFEDVRGTLLEESGNGFKLVLDPPAQIDADSAAFDVVRALASAYRDGGAEGAADVLAKSEKATDQHLWAVVDELVAQLPAADEVAKSLAAVQRNASTLKNLAKGIGVARAEIGPARQRTLFD